MDNLNICVVLGSTLYGIFPVYVAGVWTITFSMFMMIFYISDLHFLCLHYLGVCCV